MNAQSNQAAILEVAASRMRIGMSVFVGLSVAELVAIAVAPRDAPIEALGDLPWGLAAVEVCALLFLAAQVDRWMRSAWTVLRSAGAALPHSENWLSAHWLIPITNLYLPYQNMRRIVDHALGGQGRALLRGWWALWVFGCIRWRFTVASDEPFCLPLGMRVVMVAAAGVLLLNVVRRSTQSLCASAPPSGLAAAG
jgi:hypothetical protein